MDGAGGGDPKVKAAGPDLDFDFVDLNNPPNSSSSPLLVLSPPLSPESLPAKWMLGKELRETDKSSKSSKSNVNCPLMGRWRSLAVSGTEVRPSSVEESVESPEVVDDEGSEFSNQVV